MQLAPLSLSLSQFHNITFLLLLYIPSFTMLSFNEFKHTMTSFGVEKMLYALPVVFAGLIIIHHTSWSYPRYVSTFRKRSSFPLILHIAAGSFELVRFHVTAAFHAPTPDAFDLVAALVQSATNLYLAKTLVRGNETTRPSYQAGGIMRPIVSTIAFFKGDAYLHRGSVKLVNSFIYTRMIIYLAQHMGLSKTFSQSTIYAFGVFLGAVIAVSESQLPLGVPIYIAFVGILTSWNRVAADQLKGIKYVLSCSSPPVRSPSLLTPLKAVLVLMRIERRLDSATVLCYSLDWSRSSS